MCSQATSSRYPTFQKSSIASEPHHSICSGTVSSSTSVTLTILAKSPVQLSANENISDKSTLHAPGRRDSDPGLVGSREVYLAVEQSIDNLHSGKDRCACFPRFGASSGKHAQQGAFGRALRAALGASPLLAGLLPAALADSLLAAPAQPQVHFDLAKAPEVVSVLHPADLKKAVLGLGTKGTIEDAKSPTNILAFNNATAPANK